MPQQNASPINAPVADWLAQALDRLLMTAELNTDELESDTVDACDLARLALAAYETTKGN